MSEKPWMIYGATGYTGTLAARRAVELGLRPVLAGRNPEKVVRLAEELNLESRVVDLEQTDSVEKLTAALEDMELVLHCAGPFIDTVEVMADACMRARAHYLDITGEIPVYKYLQSIDDRAEAAGIMLLPGVGFDIVPTDCLGLKLKNLLPEAMELTLCFVGSGSASAGTAKSALAQAPYGSQIRRERELVSIPHLSNARLLDIAGEPREMYSIPWGDVFTAYYTTGIPNIEVLTSIGPGQARFLRMAEPFLGLLKYKPILNFAQKQVEKYVKGPDQTTRETSRSYIWGEVRTRDGNCVEARLDVLEGYNFTVESSLRAVGKVLEGRREFGFMTPARIFGEDFVLEIKGSKYHGIKKSDKSS